MKKKTLHLISILLIFISLILEVGQSESWFEISNPEFLFGISLGLILIAMSINVKIIRTFGINPQTRKASQLILVVSSLYFVAVYGLELI